MPTSGHPHDPCDPMEASLLIKRHRLEDPYVVAGNRAYLIGTQDGRFPPLGDHIPGEMGGLWIHPYKILQGFQIGIVESDGPVRWMTAGIYRQGPWCSEHDYAVDPDLTLRRRQWVPDDRPGLVVEFWLENTAAAARAIRLVIAFESDLHPGWLDPDPRGHDLAEAAAGGLTFRSPARGWAARIVADREGEWVVPAPAPFPPHGDRATGMAVFPLTVTPGWSRGPTLWITADSEERGLAFPTGSHRWRDDKARRYRDLRDTARVTVPDRLLTDALEWSKYQVDWLVRTVPEIGTGLGAGLPEYPWWFSCDNHYALQGALAFGQHRLAEETLALLDDVSRRHNGNGRVIHEVSTTGRVFNPGNTQETPQFVVAVWATYAWTGHRAWLAALYPAVRDALTWILSQDPSGRDLAPGYGIIEIEGLDGRMLDTAVYTWAGLAAGARIATVLGDWKRAADWALRARRLRRRILTLFWIPSEGLFGDVLADPRWIAERRERWAARAEARGRVDAARRYRSLRLFPRGAGEAVLLMKNWIINVPMEMGMAPRARALAALRRMRAPDFRGAYGLYLSGTEQADIMTISTGVQAVAEVRYGQADAALDWMRAMAGTLGLRMPGSLSEMSPDGGCFVQAWTAYGLWVPVVTGFFGLTPDAGRRTVDLEPVMPSAWAEARADRIPMGDTQLSCTFEREQGEVYRVTTEEPWTVRWRGPWTVAGLSRGEPEGRRAVRLQRGGSVVLRRPPSAP